ncbi:serine/threonine protein kinase [Planctomicrobium sp. SH668]|uniref:serine/threonine protein kinase n=1 Tax=Planctomicrobium sp. SH668 TaxID=3448126 RepID=UPI003F5B216F
MSADFSPPDQSTGESPTGDLSRIGRYTISKRLGAGGMGIVYLAVDSELKRDVALKVLAKDRANNPILVRRFKSEGQAAALLQHKNIVSVYEAGQDNGYLFLALEFVEGIDLLEWVNRRGPISVKRSIEIIRQAAEALQHAYERNIVHRDIKPSNLMISKDGTVKLTDMGLARSIDETLDTTITRDGTTVGTVDYMAPEQASNSKAADIRSDIYSLGCTWFHLLVGRPPYPEGSVTNKISAHISSPIPDPSSLNPNVTEAVVAIIHRMMAKKKEQRYQTPAELLEDLNNPTLRNTQGLPNLLDMFGDDVIGDEEGNFLSPTLETKNLAVVPAIEPVAGQKRSTSAPRKKSKLPQQKTRELPARPEAAQRGESLSAEFKKPLPRLNRNGSSSDGARNVPWGLISLGAIVIVLALVLRFVVRSYSVIPAGGDPYIPYVDPIQGSTDTSSVQSSKLQSDSRPAAEGVAE